MEKNKTVPTMTKKQTPVKQENNPVRDIEDKDLKETLDFINSKKILTIKYNMHFETSSELRQYILEELGNFLNEQYNEVHEKLSEIRKQGKETTVLNFKLMTIPLKIKMFLATYQKKDFEKVLSIIQEIKRGIEEKSKKA